jgi:radical SAM protein with 4Fe4S-binding SPASM domain
MKIFNFSQVAPQIPNILFRGNLNFNFEKLPFSATHISWKKRINFFVAGLNQYFLPEKPFGFPVIAQVEPSNICNLRCSLCLSSSINHERKPALLSIQTFKKLIDEFGDYFLLMIFWNWGEPFLNPDALEMISYATSKGILIHSSTNGNIPFTEDYVNRMIDSKLTSLIIAMDGANQETYQEYRIGGDIETVKNNIQLIQKIKREKQSQTPRITVRFVAMQQNEEEMKLVENLAKSFGADYFATKSVDLPPEIGSELDKKFRPEEDSLRRYDYVPDTFKRKQIKFQCMRPWKRITLDSSGEVIPCEYDYKNKHSFGNISGAETVTNIWKSIVSQDFRNHFNLGTNHYYLCENCTYKNMKNDDCILEAHPL